MTKTTNIEKVKRRDARWNVYIVKRMSLSGNVHHLSATAATHSGTAL